MRQRVVWLTLALWALVCLTAVLAGSAIARLGREWLISRLGDSSWWLGPAAAMAAITGVGVWAVRAGRVRFERRRLASRRRALEPLIEAASGATHVTDLARLSRLIVRLVNRSLGLSQTALFVGEPRHGCYRLVSARYPRLLPGTLILHESEPVIELVKLWRGALTGSELLPRRPSARMPLAPAASDARAWMASLEFDALVPAYLNQRLVALLALGPRRDGTRFTLQEFDLLRGLGSQVALGIENAKLFEELAANQASLIDTDKLANLGRLAAGLAHDINNPLTVISGEAQLHLERFKGRDEAMDRLLRSIIEECQRAAEMGRQVLRFAKSSVSKLGPVNVAEMLDESLALASYHVRMEQVERRVSIAASLPAIWGNRTQLEGVVLKLIFSVCQAIGRRGGVLEIQALARDRELELRIAQAEPLEPDTPPRRLLSMTALHETEQVSGKAAGPGNGHGVGWYVNQRIIQAHHGTLEAQYAADGRIGFVIRFPSSSETESSACQPAAESGKVAGDNG